MKDSFSRFKVSSIGTAIYSFISVLYLWKLYGLNKILVSLQKQGEGAFQLIKTDGYAPIKYLVGAIILGIIGILLGIYVIRFAIKNSSHWFDVVLNILILLVVIILLILIIKFITIPILRIIFTVFIAGIGILSAISNSN